ncbi:hypothetical protein L596_017255 [Steinernema carpocapsae]|uniref:DUF3105 domain-containing protein n=1 Tax=Steinernema carpocapsae TaxID=34508 RepID=A0A4U5N1G5_STECR|nr:hypothetical protein L596_017255 [Steinernema carpocapsae]
MFVERRVLCFQMTPLFAAAALTLFFGLTKAYMGPMMGKQDECDDGKTNLQVDWDENDFSQFTCMAELPWTSNSSIASVYYEIPNFNATTDIVEHRCMSDRIFYTDIPPLRGNHRPNWPMYGEYLYVPEQRWLHNLEHGSIILLYHPCVDQGELRRLRKLLTACVYRHIITPYNKLNPIYPLHLVAWGAKLQMNTVDEAAVVKFIRKHTHVAPEDISRQGVYNNYLMRPAQPLSNSPDDLHPCPSHV